MASIVAKERMERKTRRILLAIGSICYVYAVFVALHFSAIRAESKRITITDALSRAFIEVFTRPGDIFPISGNVLMWIFLLTVLGACFIVIQMSDKELKKHDNPDTVNGDAHFMTLSELDGYNMRRTDPIGEKTDDGPTNMIISREIKLALNGRDTKRNCNILVIGGSGAGKSRFFAGPNILQYNSNFVVTDPSGELLEDYGKALEDNGYTVKVFNLSDPYKGNRYNPFHYIREEKDIFIMVNTLIKNTSPSEGKAGDPFWENSEKLLISALALYLWHVYPEKDQTFANILKLINMAEIDENDSTAESPLDIMFNALEKEDPNNLAVKLYKKFKLGAGKTLKSILISVGVRLQSFELPDIQYVTSEDDFHFETFADTKQAIFVNIPTADTTFNFIVSMLYSQLFDSMYNYVEKKVRFGWQVKLDELNIFRVFQASDKKESSDAKEAAEAFAKAIKAGTSIRYNETRRVYEIITADNDVIAWRGTKEMAEALQMRLSAVKVVACERRCPYHVRFILDEFANIGQIPDFNQKLATIRKYEISCSIILQAISQLKEIYDKKWNTIVANCDTKLFLGSDDTETIEWLIKQLGKRTTVIANTSYQANGNGSTSYTHSSHELMTVDAVEMLGDDECIVRVRGERPNRGMKYNLSMHPNYKYARSVAGTFDIPVSEKVLAIKEKNSGPLRLRKKSNIAKEMAANAEDAVQKKAEAAKETSTKTSPVTSTHTKRDEVKNKAKRTDAKSVKGSIEEIDEIDHSTMESIAESLSEAWGITPTSSDTEIKEAIESLLDLEVPASDTFVYLTTN